MRASDRHAAPTAGRCGVTAACPPEALAPAMAVKPLRIARAAGWSPGFSLRPAGPGWAAAQKSGRSLTRAMSGCGSVESSKRMGFFDQTVSPPFETGPPSPPAGGRAHKAAATRPSKMTPAGRGKDAKKGEGASHQNWPGWAFWDLRPTGCCPSGVEFPELSSRRPPGWLFRPHRRSFRPRRAGQAAAVITTA